MASFGKQKVNCKEWVKESLDDLVSDRWANWRLNLYLNILKKCTPDVDQEKYLNKLFGAQISIFNAVSFQKMHNDLDLFSVLYEEIQSFCTRMKDGEEIYSAYEAFNTLAANSGPYKIEMHIAIATDIIVRLQPLDKLRTKELAAAFLKFQNDIWSQIKNFEFFEDELSAHLRRVSGQSFQSDVIDKNLLAYDLTRKEIKAELILAIVSYTITLIAVPIVWHYYGWVLGILVPVILCIVFGAIYSGVMLRIVMNKTGLTFSQLELIRQNIYQEQGKK